MADSEYSILLSNLDKCLNIFQDIEKNYIVEEAFISNFRNFFQHISQFLKNLCKKKLLLKNHPQKSKIVLCLHQLFQSFSLLSSHLTIPLNSLIIWYLSERLCWCVSELRTAVIIPLINHSKEDCITSESFHKCIHLAHNMLHTNNVKDLPVWTQLVDDLVYQAVKIAKTGLSFDYKEITSACQKLLKDSFELIDNIQGNLCQSPLLIDSLAANLTMLEERVNKAVLRLIIQVFSSPNKPLKHLVKRCGEVDTSRNIVKLDHLVKELDCQTEELMLISHFVISSCVPGKRESEISCCLASLESLDNYLVPALSAFYLSPDCQNKCNFARFLCGLWQDQLEILYKNLEIMINSYAYAQIVQSNVRDLIENLSQRGTINDISQTIVSQGWLLYKHLVRTLHSSHNIDNLFELKKVIHEFEAALSKEVAVGHIIKRAKNLLTAIEIITEDLSVIMYTSSAHVTPSTHNTSTGSEGYMCSENKNTQGFKSFQIIDSNNSHVDTNILSNKDNQSFRKSTINALFETFKNMNRESIDLSPYLSQNCEWNATLYLRRPREITQSNVMKNDKCSNFVTQQDCTSLDLEITDILKDLSTLAASLTF